MTTLRKLKQFVCAHLARQKADPALNRITAVIDESSPEMIRRSQQQSEIAVPELHPQAKELLERSTQDLKTAVLSLAEDLARQNNEEMVLRKRVKEALMTFSKSLPPPLWHVLSGALGNVLLAVGVDGFLKEIPSLASRVSLAGYAALAMIGLVLILMPRKG